MRAAVLRNCIALTLGASLLWGCVGNTPGGVPPDATSDAPQYPLPPVIEGGLGDSVAARDRTKFSCGSVRGAVTGELYCDRLYADLNWESEPGYASISIDAEVHLADAGGDAIPSVLTASGLSFSIFTGTRMAAMKLSCGTLPAYSDWGSAYFAQYGTWSAACDNATTKIEPGTSFALDVQSVGVLTSDTLGADPVDASADAFDWDAGPEVLSNSFHGTLTATLPPTGGGEGDKIYVEMHF